MGQRIIVAGRTGRKPIHIDLHVRLGKSRRHVVPLPRAHRRRRIQARLPTVGEHESHSAGGVDLHGVVFVVGIAGVALKHQFRELRRRGIKPHPGRDGHGGRHQGRAGGNADVVVRSVERGILAAVRIRRQAGPDEAAVVCVFARVDRRRAVVSIEFVLQDQIVGFRRRLFRNEAR